MDTVTTRPRHTPTPAPPRQSRELPIRCRRSASFAAVLLAMAVPLYPATAEAQKIGTDLAGLNPCLYGDCEARGSYAADPFGWTNPATMPGAILRYFPRGAFASGSYYRLNAGGFAADIESPSLSLAYDPFVFQATGVYAEGHGYADSLPGVHLKLRTSIIRLSVGADLDHVLPMRGWAVGLMVALPGVGSSKLDLSSGGFEFSKSQEDRDVDLTFGLHWRGGEEYWFMAGAFVNGIRNDSKTTAVDPLTSAELTTHGTTNAWFVREGVSVLPFVPLGLTSGTRSTAEWLREIRLGMDLEQTNISVPGEGTRARDRAYFGLDARLLPDAWNPVSRFVRFVLITGADTAGGWGMGIGLYGNGPLSFLSCNPAYSSRPSARSLGDRVDIWAATCAIAVPL